MRLTITLLICILALSTLPAQEGLWADISESRILLPARAEPSEVAVLATHYRTLALDFEKMKQHLQEAPLEFTPEAQAPIRLALPLPDGSLEVFEVVESPVMAPGLAARFPSIRSYQGRSIRRKSVSARFDYSPKGFNAAIHTPEGKVYIEPYAGEQTRYYLSFYTKNLQLDGLPGLRCGNEALLQEEPSTEEEQLMQDNVAVSFRSGAPARLRTYRLAMACTGEYGLAKGGTVEAVLATMNTAVNRTNQIFQLETATRMQLIEDNEQLIFLDGDTDPFENPREAGGLLGQNATLINSTIGLINYDIGHVFTLGCDDGIGGIASLSSVCSLNKAAGVTCHFSNNVEFIAVEIMAHEIGHQFSCGHSWNNCPPNQESMSPSNAFEPGSGSTIMSYSGSCGNANNVQGGSDEYYNIGSLEDWFTFSRQGEGATCGTSTDIGNLQPELELPYENGFFIPTSTPFELTALASDENGDELTYCWEQYNLGPASDLGSPSLDAPIFRSYPPTGNPTRVFPRLGKIVNNAFDNTEVLPTYGRNLNFRCTVRDNNPEAGGVVWKEVAFKVDENSGPFRIIAPDAGASAWEVGSYREILWDVANTDNNRVRCYEVNIRLSVDGGFTYPYLLAEGINNDGRAFVTVPDAVSDQARIRVEAANNIFFDISNEDFAIVPTSAPGFAMTLFPDEVKPHCLPEPLLVEVQAESLLGFEGPIALDLVGDLPEGATFTFSENPIEPGQNSLLNIEFNSFFEDTLSLRVLAVAEGVDTAFRELLVEVTSTDFSEMRLLSPEDGDATIQLRTDFSWRGSPNASSYELELASSATFAPEAIVESATAIQDTTYTPEALFDSGELFFWRARPVNECGPGEWLTPNTFQTIEVDCADNPAGGLPINLTNSVSTRTSTLFVEEDGIISDLNLSDVEVRFSPVNSLEISLISPAGTEVLLYDRNCLNTNRIELSFDDEAPEDIPCPPTGGMPAQPENPLSAFDGENIAGEWQLKVRVAVSGFGGGGSIRSWGLQFCAGVATTPPALLTNERLSVPPGEGTTITASYLEAEDNTATPEQLTFTLLASPAHGQLTRWSLGDTLGMGDKFSQATINTFNLGYIHDGSATTRDSFIFIVQDGRGGFLPSQVFQIEIDEDAMVGIDQVKDDNALTLFPNPAKDELNLRFRQALSGPVSVRMLSLQGQRVRESRFPEGGTQLQLNTAGLPSGIYFVHVQTEAGTFTEKVVIQR